MYSRRTLIRAVVGAALGGLLTACRNEPSNESTTAGTATPTSAQPVSAPESASTPSPSSSTTPSTTAPQSTTAPPSPATTLVAAPWSGADFGELDEFLEDTNGEGFAIVEGGVTVHAWCGNDDTYARDIASAQKSVLSLLVGRAIADGFFGIDTLVDDVLGSGWTSHGQTSAITVRHLLTMTSGLDDSLAMVSAPGTAWLYSGAFAQLFAVLSVTTGRDVDDLASECLFDPAGAQHAVFYERRTDEVAPIGMRATAKDLVAIGQVVLDRSQPGLPVGWLDASFATSQPFNSSYGFLWWLNGQESFMLPGPAPPARPGSLIPTAPVDLVVALGRPTRSCTSRESTISSSLGSATRPTRSQGLPFRRSTRRSGRCSTGCGPAAHRCTRRRSSCTHRTCSGRSALVIGPENR